MELDNFLRHLEGTANDQETKHSVSEALLWLRSELQCKQTEIAV
jgi:hypothetical protein